MIKKRHKLIIACLMVLVVGLMMASIVVAQPPSEIEDLKGGKLLGVDRPLAGPSVVGTLDAGSPTWDRIFTGDIDLNCNATSSDSGNDGMAYAQIPFEVTNTDPITVEVNAAGTTLADTVIALYCDPFDSGLPAENLVAYDDDGGTGLFSAFTLADNLTLTPGNTYHLILSTFTVSDFGDYQVDFSDNVVLVSLNPQITVSPDRLSSIQGPDMAMTKTLTISNTGLSDLEWSITEGDIPWVSTDPISGTTSTDMASLVDSAFDSTGLATGVYTGTISVDSNDPINPRVIVPLTLTVPQVSFVTPTDGQIFTATNNISLTVPVEVTVENFVIGATDDPNADGHWHLWVDEVLVGPVFTTTTSLNLELGTYVLRAGLVTSDHQELGPSDMVSVLVLPSGYKLYLPLINH
jgi:hypothetical protein